MPIDTVPSGFGAHPFVRRRVPQICRNVHDCSWDLSVMSMGDAWMDEDRLRRRGSASASPLRTKGGFTTRAASSRSRTTTFHGAAQGDPHGHAGEGDRAIERRAERPARDLTGAAIGMHGLMRPQHAALVHEREADSAAATAGAPASAALPMKSRGLARSTVQASPDSSGDTVSSMSCP